MKKMQNEIKEKDAEIQHLQEKCDNLAKSVNKLENRQKEENSKLEKKMEE